MAYDLVIIGTGPGGYVCAIRAAQLGLKTAVVEKRATFGGTCLNIGCIPSKALLYASELFEEVGHKFGKMGIGVSAPKLDLAAMMAFKDQGVDGNVKGVDFLLKKNKVDAYFGAGRIAAPGKVEVKTADGKTQTLETKSIVVATGSDVARLKGIELDEKRIVSSTGALTLPKVPEHLLVVGAGVIGLELGSVWRRLGAKVTVVEFLDGVLARHGRRSPPPGAAPVRKAGHDVQAVIQGHGGRYVGCEAEGGRRAGQRRRGGNHRS